MQADPQNAVVRAMDVNRRQTTMNLRASRARSVAAETLFLAFLLGLAGEAYGFHHDHGHANDPPAPAGAAGHLHHAPEAEQPLSLASSGRSDPQGAPADGRRASEPGSTEGPSDESPCTCLGICHGASASPLPSSPPRVQVRIGQVEAGRDPADEHRALRPPTPYLLPFANGPPTG